MFEYSWVHWATFFSAAFLLNAAPGPDLAFMLAQTARGGPRLGFAAMFGIWTGALIHVILAAVGLSAILAASALAFALVKWLGAAYLIWLGICALRVGAVIHDTPCDGASGTAWRIFGQGVLIDVLNPKVAIFFLAFLPQFVVPGAGPVWAQLVLHGVVVIAVDIVIAPPLIVAGAKVAAVLRGTPWLTRWGQRGLGWLLIALGLRLAASER